MSNIAAAFIIGGLALYGLLSIASADLGTGFVVGLFAVAALIWAAWEEA